MATKLEKKQNIYKDVSKEYSFEDSVFKNAKVLPTKIVNKRVDNIFDMYIRALKSITKEEFARSVSDGIDEHLAKSNSKKSKKLKILIEFAKNYFLTYDQLLNADILPAGLCVKGIQECRYYQQALDKMNPEDFEPSNEAKMVELKDLDFTHFKDDTGKFDESKFDKLIKSLAAADDDENHDEVYFKREIEKDVLKFFDGNRVIQNGKDLVEDSLVEDLLQALDIEENKLLEYAVKGTVVKSGEGEDYTMFNKAAREKILRYTAASQKNPDQFICEVFDKAKENENGIISMFNNYLTNEYSSDESPVDFYYTSTFTISSLDKNKNDSGGYVVNLPEGPHRDFKNSLFEFVEFFSKKCSTSDKDTIKGLFLNDNKTKYDEIMYSPPETWEWIEDNGDLINKCSKCKDYSSEEGDIEFFKATKGRMVIDACNEFTDIELRLFGVLKEVGKYIESRCLEEENIKICREVGDNTIVAVSQSDIIEIIGGTISYYLDVNVSELKVGDSC